MSKEEQPILIRTFEVVPELGDGRTIEARIVTYGETALVRDPPEFTLEREQFIPGCADHQITAAHRVKMWLSALHEEGFRGIIGHSDSLSERPDGLYSSFRVFDNDDGDKALMMVREGLLPALSVEFKALRSKFVDGVVQRVKVNIDRVSLVPRGAYAGAQVLAVREALPMSEVLLPLEFDPTIAASLARFVDVPAELQGTVES